MRRPALFAALVLVGCSDGNARFRVRESVEQLHVTHADPGTELAIYDRGGRAVQTGTADALGSLVFRQVPPGDGYVVRTTSAMPPQWSRHLEVIAADASLPSQ
jgi:hypothetical protein